MIEILDAGLLTTVQDLGRPGRAALGVPPSGALDAPSLRLANRLVGNPEGAAGLETTLTGVTVRLHAGRYLAVTGAPAPLRLDGRPVDPHGAFWAPAGSVLRVGPASAGVRSYLGIAGGIAVPPVLGSRSRDVLSGLGPEPPRPGTRLPLGRPGGLPPGVAAVPVPDLPAEPVLRLLPGPRAGWFTAAARAALHGTRYEVTPRSNRIALRLAGQALERSVSRELPSEGLLTGAIQVPPNGQPVLFLADHPTTGGYPVIAVVHPDDLPLAAQARPGTGIRFRRV
ncbi:MAG: biotin-dependent carboxyltransferase family protein [Mycobacteriales bacterium]